MGSLHIHIGAGISLLLYVYVVRYNVCDLCKVKNFVYF